MQLLVIYHGMESHCYPYLSNDVLFPTGNELWGLPLLFYVTGQHHFWVGYCTYSINCLFAINNCIFIHANISGQWPGAAWSSRLLQGRWSVPRAFPCRCKVKIYFHVWEIFLSPLLLTLASDQAKHAKALGFLIMKNPGYFRRLSREREPILLTSLFHRLKKISGKWLLFFTEAFANYFLFPVVCAATQERYQQHLTG